MRAYIWLLMFILLTTTVAADMCGENPVPDRTCTVYTPHLECDNLTYEVYRTNGTVYQEGLLRNLSDPVDGIYAFNITPEEGEYIARLCDNSTREMVSGGDSGNMWLAIILAMGIMTFGFGFAAYMIRSKELVALRVLFFLLFVIHALVMGILPFLISLNPYDSQTFMPVAAGYFSVNLLIIVFIVWMYGVKMIRTSVGYGKDDEEY